MADHIIEVNNVSKVYRINRPASGSLRQDLKMALLRALGKKNNFFSILRGKQSIKTSVARAG